jgi:hypothetical protein
MAIFQHIRRRDFDKTCQNGRMSIDDIVRSTDATLHIMIIVLLIAFVLGSWYFFEATSSLVDSTN